VLWGQGWEGGRPGRGWNRGRLGARERMAGNARQGEGRAARGGDRRGRHGRQGGIMILMIDNYDSFTWNLVQYLRELGAEVEVVRNDQVGTAEIESKRTGGIVISPGPCTPNEAGVSLAAIREFADRIPILGVCLGHQAIGQAFGGEVVHAGKVVHGKTSTITHCGAGVFRGLPNPFTATR